MTSARVLLGAFVTSAAAACAAPAVHAAASPTGWHSASGTYTYDARSGALTIHTKVSDFICDGVKVGTETRKVTFTTATEMNLSDSPGWTRPSGRVGDVTGTWRAAVPSSGSTWQLTLNPNGSWALSANIIRCGTPLFKMYSPL